MVEVVMVMVVDDGGRTRERERETGGTVEIENALCINVYVICALYDFNGALRNVNADNKHFTLSHSPFLLYLASSARRARRRLAASLRNHSTQNARSAKKLITRKAHTHTHITIYIRVVEVLCHCTTLTRVRVATAATTATVVGYSFQM